MVLTKKIFFQFLKAVACRGGASYSAAGDRQGRGVFWRAVCGLPSQGFSQEILPVLV